jgi:hypothetical protein
MDISFYDQVLYQLTPGCQPLLKTKEVKTLYLATDLIISIILSERTQTMAGYNTTVEYKGVSFMIQTQDKGPSFNYVESLVYLSGQVIASRRVPYTDHIGQPNLPTIIQELLDNLHAEILNEIVEGKYDQFIR